MIVPVETPGPTDADVIARSLRDPAAFGDLFSRHHAVIHRYLRRRFPAGSRIARARDQIAVSLSLDTTDHEVSP